MHAECASRFSQLNPGETSAELHDAAVLAQPGSLNIAQRLHPQARRNFVVRYENHALWRRFYLPKNVHYRRRPAGLRNSEIRSSCSKMESHTAKAVIAIDRPMTCSRLSASPTSELLPIGRSAASTTMNSGPVST